MASIKGIVIEIEGKTEGFVKSLNDCEKSIKNTEAALKKVNQALKLDPSNTELLAQKQSLLSQQVEQTSEKLQLLEQAANDANEALANGDISEAEYAQLQAEVELTRQKLSDLKKEADTVGSSLQASFREAGEKMQEVGEKIENVGDKMKAFGEGMTKYVTGPIAAAGAAAVASFREVDGGLDNIIRKTGVTGTQLEAYEDIMNNIATTIPTDFDTAGNAIGEVATRFRLTGQELEDVSTAFIEFSSITGADVVQSVDDTQKALSAFGLPAEEVGDLLDRLAYVSQETGTDVNTLTNGLVQNSAAFMELGLSIDQAAEFMGQMETSGANAESVMQALRKGLKSSAESGSDFAAELESLQSSILNGTDDMDGLTLAYEMFGRSGDQIYSALRSGTLDFTSMGNAAGDAGGTVKRTFDATVDPLTKSQTTMNQLKITLGDVGETMTTMVVPALESLNTALESANDWWNSLDQNEQNNILTAIAVVAAIGPVIAIIGTVVSSIGSLIGVLGTASVMMGTTGLAGTAAALGATLWPVIAVITAVIGIIWGLYEIVTGVINIIENWDVLMAQLKEDFGPIFETIGEWWDDLCNKFSEWIDDLGEKFTQWKEDLGETWDGIKEKVSEVWDNIKETVAQKIQDAKDSVHEKIEEIKESFASLPENALEWGSDMIDNFVQGIRNAWSSFTGAISDLAGYIADYIGFSEPEKGPLSDFHTFSPDLVDLWNEGIYNNLGQVQESAQAMAGTVAGGLQTTDYTGALNGISGQLAGMANGSQPINVYIGSDRIGTAIARSNQRTAYISGGR